MSHDFSESCFCRLFNHVLPKCKFQDLRLLVTAEQQGPRRWFNLLCIAVTDEGKGGPWSRGGSE